MVRKQALCPHVCRPSTEHLPMLAEVPLQGLYLTVATSLLYGATMKRNHRSRRRKQRKTYPKDWKQQSRQCRDDAGRRCLFCHVVERTELLSKRTKKPYPVWLHAAHRDHDYDNPKPVLLCLCPTCHGRYDYHYRLRQHQINLERLKHRKILVSVSY
jgi:hypothetical protein